MMILLDEIRATRLLLLAHDRFDPDLTDAELKVLRDSASSLDPEEPEAGAPRPLIRVEFVRWLVTDQDATSNIDPKGLRVYGVTLPSKLDLGKCRVAFAIDFFRCTIKGEVNLQFAEAAGLSIVDCTVDGSILADGINIRGALFFRNSIFFGEIRLVASQIRLI